MQITNEIIIDFFGQDEVVDQMLARVENGPDAEESDDDYEDVEDAEYEDESDIDEDEEDEDEEDEDEEEIHQFYRRQTLEWSDEEDNPILYGEEMIVTLNDIPDLITDSDTDELSDEEIISPHPLRRERPEDYIHVGANAPPRVFRARTLLDITNIVPRRLNFN